MKKPQFLTHWLPLIIWMSIIFLLSHQAKDQTEQTSGLILSILQALGIDPSVIEKYHIHFFVRKLAHFTEYFILFLLIFRISRHYVERNLGLLISWGLAVFYAFSDEWHQSFIPGRGAAISDVGIDAMGAALAALICAAFLTINPNFSLNFDGKVKKY
ncbi:MAG: VanZ family protein [Bacteroidota bacterium]